jgi:hypothetical protein
MEYFTWSKGGTIQQEYKLKRERLIDGTPSNKRERLIRRLGIGRCMHAGTSGSTFHPSRVEGTVTCGEGFLVVKPGAPHAQLPDTWWCGAGPGAMDLIANYSRSSRAHPAMHASRERDMTRVVELVVDRSAARHRTI